MKNKKQFLTKIATAVLSGLMVAGMVMAVTTISADIVTGGDLAVNGGDITTTATTFNLLNATATTLNIGEAGTTISVGAATGTTTVNNALAVSDIVTVTNVLGASENGMTLTITAPLATVLHNWTSALTIDVTQSNRIDSGATPAWNLRGRLMAGDFDVTIVDSVTNVFGVISKINVDSSFAGDANNETNDIQSLVGYVNLNPTAGTTMQAQTTSTITGVKGVVTRGESGAITVEHGITAATFALNIPSVTAASSIIVDTYNYGSQTTDVGINMHPFGVITTGISLDDADGGTFTTGIQIDSATTGIALTGVQATGIAIGTSGDPIAWVANEYTAIDINVTGSGNNNYPSLVYAKYTTAGAQASGGVAGVIYGRAYLKHTFVDGYGVRGRADFVPASPVSTTANMLVGVMASAFVDNAGETLTMTNGLIKALDASVSITATSEVAGSGSIITAGWFDTSNVLMSTAAEVSTVYIKAGGNGYTDYGLKVRAGNNNLTAGVQIVTTDSAVLPIGLKISSDSGSFVNGIDMSGATVSGAGILMPSHADVADNDACTDFGAIIYDGNDFFGCSDATDQWEIFGN